MMAVSDTGMGMDEETRSRIFEPFFSTKEKGKGTGLGLATVYGIVKQNNGYIWAYSESGRGSTLKVYLPRLEQDVVHIHKERTPIDVLKGSETVLLVEDDDKLLELTEKILRLYGYRVLKAQDGEEALKVHEEHEGFIQVMVTDIVMPKMSGRELAERLQSVRPEMKVLYMSGYTDNAIVHHQILDSKLSFLQKPFTPEGLGSKVREVLDSP
jgi:CheY-like chemotaxis protein